MKQGIALKGALTLVAAFASVGMLVGCASNPPPPPQTAAVAPEPPIKKAPVEPNVAAKTGDSVSTPTLHVSDEIARLCNLPAPKATPSFDFDSANVSAADREVLSAVAKCLTDGPLKGRNLSLTGRADARGESEYNMSLGGSRADSVKRFLRDLGVADTRVSATSRGELDATGTDEESMAKDRRVDLLLAN